MYRALLCLTAVLTACGKSDDGDKAGVVATETPPPATAPASADAAMAKTSAALAPAPSFPAKTWVRTTMFDGTPFVGFTYVDRSKGPSIKGVPTAGLTKAEWAQKLRAPPTHTLQPIPEGHAVTPLAKAEVEDLGLPTPPEWLEIFEGRAPAGEVANKKEKLAAAPRTACIEVAKLVLSCSSEITAEGSSSFPDSVKEAGGPAKFCDSQDRISRGFIARFWPVCPASDCVEFARCVMGK
jgi:hypothetical protein